MLRMNYLAIVVAAMAAFVASSVWYTIFGNAIMELRGIDPPTAAGMATLASTMLFVIVQSLVVASPTLLGNWELPAGEVLCVLGPWCGYSLP